MQQNAKRDAILMHFKTLPPLCLWCKATVKPHVSNGKHPGNILDSQIKNKDICIKRYIGKINGVLQEFYFAHSSIKCMLMQKYCTSVYGCE